VALEDLIETLLGAEIVDETDRVVDLRKSLRPHPQSDLRHEG
jgi:CBS domain containing-hemolysin-like protein